MQFPSTMTQHDALQNLHYFFSTAPQVLGALLAITGAFVALKLNRIKDELNSISQKMIDIGSPKNQTQFNADLKELGLTQMITKDIRSQWDSMLFGNNYDDLKYSQIGGNFNKIVTLIENKLKPHLQKILKDYEGLIFNYGIFQDYDAMCDSYLLSKKKYDNYLNNTEKVFLRNGFLLIFLLFFFFFLPQLSNNIYGYGLALSIGFLIATISLLDIITYVVSSLKNSD